MAAAPLPLNAFRQSHATHARTHTEKDTGTRKYERALALDLSLQAVPFCVLDFTIAICAVGRFEVPLSFQQTNRPVPVVYSLDTQLQLTNNLKLFLLDPSTASMTPDDWDFNGAFSRGTTVAVLL